MYTMQNTDVRNRVTFNLIPNRSYMRVGVINIVYTMLHLLYYCLFFVKIRCLVYLLCYFIFICFEFPIQNK